MLVYGQLEKAQIESFTAVTPSDTRPSASATPNRLIYCTDTKEFQISDGTSWKAQANLSGTQTLSGKTFSDALQIAEISTPSTPASGFRKLYAKNDNKLYQLNSSGVEAGLGAAFSDVISQQLNSTVASFTAAEAITALDAVCVELHNGTGSDVYRVFKADNSLSNRRSFAGISVNAATATPHILNHTMSAGLVTSNVVTATLNGRVMTVTFASSSDATLQALATLIAADVDVTSAVVTVVGGNQTGADDRTIVITGKGARTITITTVVTLGASQATFSSTTTQSPVGSVIQLQEHGPLVGFSGLTVGGKYYLSTAGGITLNPSDPYPIFVGRAVSTTVLFVDPFGVSKLWGTSEIFVRSHGATTPTNSNAVQDVEHYNFVAWANGTAATAGARCRSISGGNGTYNSAYYQLDGRDTSSNSPAQFQHYNKVAWSSDTNRASSYNSTACLAFNGFFYAMKGDNGGSVNTSTKWNSAAWSNGPTLGATAHLCGAYNVNALLICVGGNTTNEQDALNSSDVASTLTVFPVTNATNGSGNSPSSKGIAGSSSSSNNYEWNGTSWSSAFTGAYTSSGDPFNQTGAFSASRNVTFYNGGSSGASCINTSQTWNGITFTSTTASSNARGGAQCGVF